MLKIDQILKINGIRVRIIDIDSDPACMVHGVLVGDPDRSVWFWRSEVSS